jgi:thiol-disulfide isomerase/thioredoxin
MQRELPKGVIMVVIAVLMLVGVEALLPVSEEASPPTHWASADIIYFFSSTCEECAKARPWILKLQKAYPELRVEKIGINGSGGPEFLKRKGEEYGLTPDEIGAIPSLFVESERKAYPGATEVINAIKKMLAKKAR